MSVSQEQGRFIGSDKDVDPRHSEDEKSVDCVEGRTRSGLRE